ncbi:MAG: hypothetical protein IJ068_06305 [Bacilli bacterium]|nr:hypothetical protein [Bacilli bacterium]
MNKFMHIIKIILIFLLVYFQIIFEYKFGYNINFFKITFIILEIMYIILTIKDLIKKENILKDKKYLILQIIVLIITNLIYIRCLYDKSFIYNNKTYYLELVNYFKMHNSNENIYLKDINIYYLHQNFIYFNILFISLLIYHKVNLKEMDKN